MTELFMFSHELHENFGLSLSVISRRCYIKKKYVKYFAKFTGKKPEAFSCFSKQLWTPTSRDKLLIKIIKWNAFRHEWKKILDLQWGSRHIEQKYVLN